MAFNSFLKPTQTLCQQDIQFTAAQNGIIATTQLGGTIAGVVYQNFNPQTSKIIGIKGKTLGGAVPFQNVSVDVLTGTLATNLANGANVAVVSSLATDTNLYTVYWVNTLYSGLSPC